MRDEASQVIASLGGLSILPSMSSIFPLNYLVCKQADWGHRGGAEARTLSRCEPVATTRLLPDPQVRVAVLLGACVDGEDRAGLFSKSLLKGRIGLWDTV